MSHYFRIWLRFTLGSFQVALTSRLSVFIFTLGKIMRFVFFMLVLVLVVTQTKTLAGYTLHQSLIFFLTYNVIDTITQLLFRDVYRFRPFIINGYFDYILLKPMNPLFKFLLGGADLLDLVMLIPYIVILTWLLVVTSVSITSFLVFLLLLSNAFLISSGFHIFVLALGILTTEIDHTIMIYRDITSMARFPVDIYREPLRGFITFIVPIGVMMTFPPRALFGLLSPALIFISMGIGVLFVFISLRLWRYALTQYSSASS